MVAITRSSTKLKKFFESKMGIKGLLDTGVTSVPHCFRHRRKHLAKPKSISKHHIVPLIDLSGDRSTVIEQIKQASSTLGFFQIINHGIPQSTIDTLILSIKSFNEQPTESKLEYYGRNTVTGGSHVTDSQHVFRVVTRSWRDTLDIQIAPTPSSSSLLPQILRSTVKEWDEATFKLGGNLLELMSEGLGLGKNNLKNLLGWRRMGAHYYPFCPQPDLTMGLASHTDPFGITVLVQNEVPGLQVKFEENDWADVVHIPGALIVLIGDLLQVLSNNEYKGGEHRVLANSDRKARISSPVFFNPSDWSKTYGPLPELISTEKPPLYGQFKFPMTKKWFVQEQNRIKQNGTPTGLVNTMKTRNG